MSENWLEKVDGIYVDPVARDHALEFIEEILAGSKEPWMRFDDAADWVTAARGRRLRDEHRADSCEILLTYAARGAIQVKGLDGLKHADADVPKNAIKECKLNFAFFGRPGAATSLGLFVNGTRRYYALIVRTSDLPQILNTEIDKLRRPPDKFSPVRKSGRRPDAERRRHLKQFLELEHALKSKATTYKDPLAKLPRSRFERYQDFLIHQNTSAAAYSRGRFYEVANQLDSELIAESGNDDLNHSRTE